MAGVRPQQGLGLDQGRVTEDHRLAAAEVEPGDRRLVGHGPGQGQHVLQGVVLVGVGAEADAAERRAQLGRVHGDDRPQAARPVVAEHDFLVSIASDAVEEVHLDPG